MQEMKQTLFVCCTIERQLALFAMKVSITETHEKNRVPSFTKINLSEEFD
jgi:hypothetical protein